MPTEEEIKKLEDERKRKEEEEKKKLLEEHHEDDDDKDPVAETLKDLKKNYVPKEKYDKLEKHYNELLDTVRSGKNFEEDDSPKLKDVNLDELRSEMFNPDNAMSNLDFIEHAMLLRAAVIEQEGPDADPFLPHMTGKVPTDEDRKCADQVADVFLDCINKCEGDSGSFTALLQSRINDDSIVAKIKNRMRTNIRK